MERRICYQIKDCDLPCRVRMILRTRLGLSDHQIRSAKFRPGGICVNRIPARVTAFLQAGDVVEVLLEQKGEKSRKLEAAFGSLDILYEDQDLLAVNKPAGMALHPAHGHYRDTLANVVAGYYETQGILTRVRSIGRLDKDTSGAVMFAKNQPAAARLWEDGRIQKEYLALVMGHLGQKQGSMEKPIGKKAGCLNEMELSEDGKYAKTNYRVLEEFRDCSLVSLIPETGRTHQIRVHMASLGHPLAGDPIYGKYWSGDTGRETEKPQPDQKGQDRRRGGRTEPEAAGYESLHRAALHCRRMTLLQPFTGEKLELWASLPEDMQMAIRHLRGLPDSGISESSGRSGSMR